MRRIYLIVIFLVLIFVGSSCHSNKLKNNEKALTQKILTEEDQLARQEQLRIEKEKLLADSLAKLPKGFRLKEERRIDPNNPPMVIDVAGNRSNPQRIKLSQLFSKIEYVRLEPNQDSSELLLGMRCVVAPSHIYLISGRGSIFQFDRKGVFICTVCVGNLQFTRYNGMTMITKEQSDLFEGATGAYWNGDKLCYQYENRPAQKSYIVTFEDKEGTETSTYHLPGTVETKNPINGKGKILTELKKGSSATATPKAFLLGSNTLAFAQQRKPVRQTANFINVVSITGDTISEFKDNDPIKNFSKSVSRGVDDGDIYYNGSTLFIRQSFNDTIYQLISPNRLVPRYILNFGDLGIRSAQEGIDPGVSLKEKLVLQSFLETTNFIFITYSKDYSCPNTAKQGTLKYSRLVYDKKTRKLTPIYIDEEPFIPKGKMTWPSAPNIHIDNDLDGIPFIFPTLATANGQPFSIISGDVLLKSDRQDLPFKNIRESDRIIAIYH